MAKRLISPTLTHNIFFRSVWCFSKSKRSCFCCSLPLVECSIASRSGDVLIHLPLHRHLPTSPGRFEWFALNRCHFLFIFAKHSSVSISWKRICWMWLYHFCTLSNNSFGVLSAYWIYAVDNIPAHICHSFDNTQTNTSCAQWCDMIWNSFEKLCVCLCVAMHTCHFMQSILNESRRPHCME